MTDDVAEKRCFKCGEMKPMTGFYKHSAMKDGRLNKCKECTKADVSANYDLRREQYAEYEKKRSQRPERKAMASSYAKNRRQRNPEKERVRWATSNAIRDGRLLRQPCSVCGEPKAEAHHNSYTDAFDVTWLCRRHHLERHHKEVVSPEKITINLDDAK